MVMLGAFVSRDRTVERSAINGFFFFGLSVCLSSVYSDTVRFGAPQVEKRRFVRHESDFLRLGRADLYFSDAGLDPLGVSFRLCHCEASSRAPHAGKALFSALGRGQSFGAFLF